MEPEPKQLCKQDQLQKPAKQSSNRAGRADFLQGLAKNIPQIIDSKPSSCSEPLSFCAYQAS